MKKTCKIILLVMVGLLFVVQSVWSGPPQGTARAGFVTGRSTHWQPAGERTMPRRFNHPAIVYYVPYATPALVVSPYGPAYYLPSTVVVTAPFFCALHNDGFVSRVGLLDHMAGTHKIPLDAAALLCPNGGVSCVFPSY